LYPAHHGIIANYFINPNNDEYFNLSRPNVTESVWYRGEAFWETAKRNGIITASYFWPGSEIDLSYRKPDYSEDYEHNRPYEQRVEGVLKWLQLPDSVKPKFITLYFDETDSKAHKYGVNSDSLLYGIKRVDNLLKMLDSGLIAQGIADNVNLIILSDHGMIDMSPDNMIWINKIINEDSKEVKFVNLSSMGWLHIRDKSKIPQIYEKLKSAEKGYKVYLKKDLPARFNLFRHPFLGDIIIIPQPGYSLRDKKGWDTTYIATHGYDNELMDMHGIFIARGPAFKNGFETGFLNNLDIYPLLCKIYGIEHSSKIDGDLMRIIHILNE
jgi:predicted AlkP superfamily pyrophosphatase or phosphodiesterase